MTRWDGQAEFVECSHCSEVIVGPVDMIEEIVDRHHVQVHGCPENASDELNPPTMVDRLMAELDPELECGHTAGDHVITAAMKSVAPSPMFRLSSRKEQVH